MRKKAKQKADDYGDLLLALAEAVRRDEDLPNRVKQRLFKTAWKLAVRKSRES